MQFLTRQGWRVIASFLLHRLIQMFTLCKLLRGKNEIKLFPTILNVNLLSSLEAYICQWASEEVTFQNSCTSTVLGSSCLCRHHVSNLTMGAVDGMRGECAGQRGPWRWDWVLMAAPSPSPPTYPVVGWSVPGWGSSCSSHQAGAGGCSVSAGCRLWMGGARRAYSGGSCRAGGPPGGGAWL